MYIGLTSISIGSFLSVLFRFFYSLPNLTRSTSVREFFTFSHSSKSHLHALLHKFSNPYLLFLLMSYATWNAFWEWRGEILLTKRKYRTIATWALGNAWKCQWNWNVPVTSGWNNSLVWVSEWVSEWGGHNRLPWLPVWDRDCSLWVRAETEESFHIWDRACFVWGRKWGWRNIWASSI